LIQPIGDRVMTPFGKLMGSAVSPDGRYLVGTSADRSVDLQVFDLDTCKPVAAAGTLAAASFAAAAANAGYANVAYLKISDGTVGQEGPVFSPDGKFLFAPVATGIVRYPFNADGSLGDGTKISIPTAGGLKALTSGMAFSPDGSTLFAAVNGQNTVVAIDPVAGAVKQTFTVGIAPRQLKFIGTRLFVSNEGGRPASAGETTMGSYGTQVPADTNLGTSTTGTVSVIDTANASAYAAAAVTSINVQLHPTAMHLDGTTLHVAAVNGQIVAPKTRGIDARGPALTFNKGQGTAPATGHATHSTTASLTRFTLPSDKQIQKYTAKVYTQNGWDSRSVAQAKGDQAKGDQAKSEQGGNQPVDAIPKRIGDPSPIKHVFLLVKENGSYDQLYGDMKQGNGDPSVTQFGQKVTPNQHALATQFG
jgi:hypothetical protein